MLFCCRKCLTGQRAKASHGHIQPGKAASTLEAMGAGIQQPRFSLSNITSGGGDISLAAEVERLRNALAEAEAKLKVHKESVAGLEAKLHAAISAAFSAAGVEEGVVAAVGAPAQAIAPTSSTGRVGAASPPQHAVAASKPLSQVLAPLPPPTAEGRKGGAGLRPSSSAASSGCCGPSSGGSKLSKVHPEP